VYFKTARYLNSQGFSKNSEKVNYARFSAKYKMCKVTRLIIDWQYSALEKVPRKTSGAHYVTGVSLI
jgi:hypothetical protein